jgi:hypothetical protein
MACVAIVALPIGFFIRRKFSYQAQEILRNDPERIVAASREWETSSRSVCAETVMHFGFVLKALGTGWTFAGIFFVAAFVLLVVWRPQPELLL